ncbi:hypothetical protein BDF22DRAFT_61009 [Syncephalis plumigaleata]|nr:hypothetical protein BDF22DRAFT_61009 [Syncephalis plumigaleata]
MQYRAGTVKWKREVVPDHKFDYVDITLFHDKSLTTRLKYCMVYLMSLKDIAEYILDIVTLFQFISSPSQRYAGVLGVTSWIVYCTSLLLSTAFFLWEWKKAYRIVKSRDIAYAYTNPTAYRYYCVRSYSTFCFFSRINASKGIWGRLAYFIYFQLKGWKRLVFVTTPRRVLNIAIILSVNAREASGIEDDRGRAASTISVISIVLWYITLDFTAVACLLYPFTVRKIRDNLKKYVCHKIDKRISTLIMRKSRKLRAKEQREREILEEELKRARGRPVRNDAPSAVNNAKSLPEMRNTTSNDANVLFNLARSSRTADVRPSNNYVGSHTSSQSRSSARRFRVPRINQHSSEASAHVFAPIDQTMYGHSVQYGYHQRLGVGVNAVNSDHEESDVESSYSCPSNGPLPPFAHVYTDSDTDHEYPIPPPPRRPASPATSVSSNGSGGGSGGRRHNRRGPRSHHGNDSDSGVSDRYAQSARRTRNQPSRSRMRASETRIQIPMQPTSSHHSSSAHFSQWQSRSTSTLNTNGYSSNHSDIEDELPLSQYVRPHSRQASSQSRQYPRHAPPSSSSSSSRTQQSHQSRRAHPTNGTRIAHPPPAHLPHHTTNSSNSNSNSRSRPHR